MSHTPPQVLRIKRKRGEDPLQALILESRQPSKKSKPSTPITSAHPSPSEQRNWLFQLEKTEELEQSQAALESLLAESKNDRRDARQFVIPKKHTLEDSVIPNELTDMVANFLTVDEPTTRKKRKPRRQPNEAQREPSLTTSSTSHEKTEVDYVFDTYKLSELEPLTEANYPKSQIGYIRFFDDENYDLMQLDDDNLPNKSDDEDSNAESFYQNDYPEDEDAGAFSDSYANFEEEEDVENGVAVLETPEDFEGTIQTRGGEEFDNLYEDLMNHTEDIYDPDETFERHRFFADEGDDELAIHRDRIFSRLQKMIDEE